MIVTTHFKHRALERLSPEILTTLTLAILTDLVQVAPTHQTNNGSRYALISFNNFPEFGVGIKTDPSTQRTVLTTVLSHAQVAYNKRRA